MNRIVSYSALFAQLFLLTGLLIVGTFASPVLIMAQEDTIRVEEVLVMDTVDLKIHGPSNDVTFYMNGMVFLSNTKYHQKMIPDHITFGVTKAYFVPLEYIALESSKPLFINDNFPYPPAGMSFTRNYKNVYFTKSVELHGRRNIEKIFEMSITDGKGSSHNQLSFTSDPSRYMHPAISLDDSFMIFSSDRTPSSGGLDLFISRKTTSGWTSPANMGNTINTSGHEWFPYLDHDNNLYFSSSGHMGYGGYDVYVCYFNGTNWDNPQNMTSYVNTVQDELGFSIHPNKQMAIFSKVVEAEKEGEILKMSLNNEALLLSGNEESKDNDISLLLKDLVETGYTAGKLPTKSEAIARNNQSSSPLITEEEKIEKPVVTRIEPEQAELSTEPAAQESEPEPVINLESTEPAIEEAQPETDPNKLVFRVQILSSTQANSQPSVTISGTSYSTFEYFFKGAFRITVGEFDTIPEANAFRSKCKSSGFDQAWVAAFRGTERETDPAVFRK